MESIRTFKRPFLHTHRVLPPPLTHYIFNNLVGFLKMVARDDDVSNALHDFGQTVRILTNMATQVSDMSIRDIRRSKIEPLMIPSGSLWYPSSAPKGPMFPRNLGTSNNPFEPVLQNFYHHGSGISKYVLPFDVEAEIPRRPSYS